MKLTQTKLLLIISTLGLTLLTACGNNTQADNPQSTDVAANSPNAATSPATTTKPSQENAENHDDGHSQGGQVVESGPYHLELLPIVENQGVHLDFFLQNGDDHQAIPDANVKAQIQSPGGESQTVDFTYDAADKHYEAVLPQAEPGEYQVAVQTDINGEKVNGRFSFKK
ncbi:hypothetical protein [Lyngbya aestuarii]|uniref:hypothetical protein n=1 Tax=Lyngbya aestuarii TaxID=118322 RepID=UPI00403E034D